jgi:hypothetical protein
MFVPLFYFVLFLGLLPLSYILFQQKTVATRSTSITPYAWLVFLSSICEFFLYQFAFESLYWSRFYLLLDFVAIFYFMQQLFKPNYRYFFIFSLLAYLFFYSYLLCFWHVSTSLETDSYLTMFETGFVLISSVLWFRSIFISLSETSLLEAPNYYFICGFLIYYLGTFFLFLLAPFFMKIMSDSFLSYWNLNIILGIVLRILLLLGIWKLRTK